MKQINFDSLSFFCNKQLIFSLTNYFVFHTFYIFPITNNKFTNKHSFETRTGRSDREPVDRPVRAYLRIGHAIGSARTGQTR